MHAPDYLVSSLHGEYDRLTAQLTGPARVRDEAVVAKALHEGYRRGRVDALAELRTAKDVAADLGITTGRLRVAARQLGVGWDIGPDRLYRAEDVEALRNRVHGRPGRPPKLRPETP